MTGQHGSTESSPTPEPASPSDASRAPAPKQRRAGVWLAVLAQWGKQLAVLVAVLTAFTLGLWFASSPQPGAEATSPAASTATLWTCSMHPQIQLPEPGKCPICGMDLIPLDTAKHTEPTQVSLSPAAVKLAELRTTKIERGDLAAELRLLGRLEYDETAVRTITSWVGGRIDKLYVSTLGAVVGAGQPLAAIYSPEVYAAHQDLILAKAQVNQMQQALPVARSAAEAALKSARQRLRLLGIRGDELDAMEQADSPSEQVTIRSPFGGTVLEQMVNQGAYVTTGTPLFRVTALGTIWVQLDAYETDLGRIKKGDPVAIQVASFPGEEFEGKVKFIDPLLDPETRTARVRVEVTNKNGRLRPGMFAEAVLELPDDDRVEPPLLVPDSAVLFTGERSVVFVEVPGQKSPTYQARDVQLGPRAGNAFPVVSGLSAGERVVTHGAFALDAELQIRGGDSMMMRGDELGAPGQEPFDVPGPELNQLGPLFETALALHVALSKDDLGTAKAAFVKLEQQVTKVRFTASPRASERWKELSKVLMSAADVGKEAPSLSALRRQFEQAGVALIEILRRYGNPLALPVHLAFCPMAFDGKGAEWIQSADTIENPYFGARMFRCGEIRGMAEPGQRLPNPVAATGQPPAAPPAGHQH